MTLGGFFAFQVAGASAVSIRSPGKDAVPVAIWDDTRRAREGSLVCGLNGYSPGLLSQKENVCAAGCTDINLRITRRLRGKRGQNLEAQPVMYMGAGGGLEGAGTCLEPLKQLGLGEGKKRASWTLLRPGPFYRTHDAAPAAHLSVRLCELHRHWAFLSSHKKSHPGHGWLWISEAQILWQGTPKPPGALDPPSWYLVPVGTDAEVSSL